MVLVFRLMESGYQKRNELNISLLLKRISKQTFLSCTFTRQKNGGMHHFYGLFGMMSLTYGLFGMMSLTNSEKNQISNLHFGVHSNVSSL
jgi:hypothetical protein